MNFRLGSGFVFFVSILSHAGDLKAPFSLPTAQVLPAGVRSLSLKGVLAGATDKLDANGASLPLAANMEQDISFATLIDGQASGVDKAKIQQAMASIGAKSSDVLASTRGQVNVSAAATVPVLAWGIHKRLTVAIAVPVVNSRTSVALGVIQQDENLLNSFRQELLNKGVPDKEAEFATKMANPINETAKDYGYETPQSEGRTQIGDIKFLTKGALFVDRRNALALQMEVTAPTGTQKNSDKIIDVASGDGQWDLALGLLHDWRLFQGFTLSSFVGYTVQLPDSNRERIPLSETSSLTPDIDDGTQRNLGDTWATQLGADYEFFGVRLGIAYSYQYKTRDTYKGTKFAVSRYDYLSQETQQRMHSATGALGYSTLELYKKGHFFLPMSLTVSHTGVLAGRNVVHNPTTAADLSLYF